MKGKPGEAEAGAFRAGVKGRSDCLVTYVPGDAALSVEVESSVRALFGRHVAAAAKRAAGDLGLWTGKISVVDEGALDHVVEARVEAALMAAGTRTSARAEGDGRRADQPVSASLRDRPRRTRLYVPGNQPDLILNAGLFGADCVVLDLEDSVPPDRKDEARLLVRKTIKEMRRLLGASEIVVRVNPLTGLHGEADVEEMAPAFPQAIILPKCEGAPDVERLDAALDRFEAQSGIPPGSIFIMPLIETALGVVNAFAIAKASPRNVALCFGAEDFARDLGLRRSSGGEECLLARQTIVLAAAASGIQPQDSVFSNVDDEAGFATACAGARSLGFSGMGIIHPRQIEIAHRAFSPGDGEMDEARRIVEALAAAEAEGRGVVALDGKMIDAPVAARARRILAAFERSPGSI
jgi:citrate lyase subunit beta/citryl-CoA lyase